MKIFRISPNFLFFTILIFLISFNRVAFSAVSDDENSKQSKSEKLKLKNQQKKEKKKKQDKLEKKEQDQLLKKEILDYMRKNKDRKAGEGWLYLAEHYNELEDYNRSHVYLKKIIRSPNVEEPIKWEARLLRANIYSKSKLFKFALKDLDKLIAAKPDREVLVRAKIQRAELFGRNLTNMKNIYEAYQRYYKAFPEKSDLEASEYMMGFQRGYDLEIAMKALEAWEEISKFKETNASNRGLLQIAILHGFDLSNAERSVEFLEKIKPAKNCQSAVDAKLIYAIINHFTLKKKDFKKSMKLYGEYRNKTDDLFGYRIAGILQGQLAFYKLNEADVATRIFETLLETPPHLIASASLSLEKRKEESEEAIDWAVLACKMAGYICEYNIKNPDRARYYYEKGLQQVKEREEEQSDAWLKAAIARTEPKVTPAQMLFELAFEKYRSRKLKQAIKYYENFIEKYPNHSLRREALYRVALITDDDLMDYSNALQLYRRYLINCVPKKSTWDLDVLYDWGRLDEIRYRIGNLLTLHLKDPVQALEVFHELVSEYPDSYWAKQGFKDSIRIYREDLGDFNKANEMMLKFIAKYPESSEASDYRLKLYKIYLQQAEQIKALRILRSYLDHTLPSKKDYFKRKQEWRDLAFRVREESLRNAMEVSGNRDKIDTYQNLMGVVSLASSSKPLESLISEIEALDISDELRWGLTYRAGIHLYIRYPDKAKALFTKLEKNATGTPQLACILTLGNIAYRIDKNVADAVKWYEKATSMGNLTDLYLEAPTYRLGRLYLVQGKGIEGLSQLSKFVARFPRSRYVPRAYMAMGEAYAVLHHPKQAIMFYRRAMNLSVDLSEKAGKAIAALKTADTTEKWLESRLQEAKDNKKKENAKKRERKKKINAVRISNNNKKPEDQDLEMYSPEELYNLFLSENQKQKRSFELCTRYLFEILKRAKVDPIIREKTVRHYISFLFFIKRNPEILVENAQMLLLEHNYASWQSEILFRMAQAKEYFLKEYASANKSYFEYLSFYPESKRVLEIRRRIPAVYAKDEDLKNAYRFYQKLIDDSSVSDADRTDASIALAKLKIENEKKEEAISTLVASLVFDSDRRGEICLHLERLTSKFNYVQQALEEKGNEEFRFKALKRIVKKAVDDDNYPEASKIISKYTNEFTLPSALAWLAKKTEELGKRGVIESIEQKIDQYPEEDETPSRMFRLAKLVEGTENTKYRSQDLFYEITLVYPKSEFFRESKIRADNTRAINAVAELSDMLKKGTRGTEGEEIIIERARLLKEDLKDLGSAMENYESFIKLFPNSERSDEVYLDMGDIILAKDNDAKKAVECWEKGLTKSRDPFTREALTKRINNLKVFREKILYTENENAHEEAFNQVLRIWRIEHNTTYALGLLVDAISQLKNKPDVARLRYYSGRIYEESDQLKKAYSEYNKALRNIYHPGCRKDMLFYRMARIKVQENKKRDAYNLYRALTQRYPKSLLSRSAFYWLYKFENDKENYSKAHYYIRRLLQFRALYPSQREELLGMEKEVEAKMNIKEMIRLQGYSKSGGSELPYFIGKVLENDLRDFDKAIDQYKSYLKSSPPTRQSRVVIKRIANLYEEKGDYVSAVGYLDQLLGTYEPAVENLDLIVKIGSLVEDQLANPELATLFYSTVASDYYKIPKIKNFVIAKLRIIEEKKIEATTKPRTRKKVKRIYTEDDDEIVEELEEIIERQVDDLQDFKQAEREMEELWDENSESFATLDIMKALVDLNMTKLMDPQKAATFYEKWLEENPDDPLSSEYTMKLYDFYTETLKDGDKALEILEGYISDNPTSVDTMAMELKLGKSNELLLRNFDEAQRIYQRIIDTKQNDPIVHEAYFRMGFVMREGYANYDEATKLWQELIDLFYNNDFADKAQFAIAFTYETYQRDYTNARANYEKILNLYPNSELQNQAREALIRIEGKN